MFCPSCGLQENQSNQFCRACGANLNAVRSALEKPDNITASAASARDEIGRAIAVKIRETTSAKELKKLPKTFCRKSKNFSNRLPKNVCGGFAPERLSPQSVWAWRSRLR